jgi:hypothetical protein
MEQQKYEQVRKLVAAALCDLVGELAAVKDPFIVGGQYSHERLLVEFRTYLQSRYINVAGATDVSARWISLCEARAFSGWEGGPETPIARDTPLEPKPKPKPGPPKPGTEGKPPTPPPAGDTDEEEGYLRGDAWKPEEDRKDNWQDEGEDWKKGTEDDE